MPVGRREGEFGAIDVGSEDDTVIADPDFLDFRYTVGGAVVDVRLLDARGGVRDVDGVLANALAELLAASARTTGFNDRGGEVEVFAEGFGNDRGIGQNRGRAGDLDLVARDSGAGDGDRAHQGCSGKLKNVHVVSPVNGLVCGCALNGIDSHRASAGPY